MGQEKWHQLEVDELVKGLSEIETIPKMEEFLERIVTPRELNDMAVRLRVWKMLEEGESYSTIRLELGVGSELISKVSNKIGYGFRRSSMVAKKREVKKPSRKHLRYKGAPSILDLLD
jgi:TrpR-related protein YerC/YecD